MPSIDCFTVPKEAKAIFNIPLRILDVERTQRWQLSYSTQERKHFLSRLLLHPADACPLPKKMTDRTIRDAINLEDYCFRTCNSTKHYIESTTQYIQSVWQIHFPANFPNRPGEGLRYMPYQN